jgi:hypothetical protein
LKVGGRYFLKCFLFNNILKFYLEIIALKLFKNIKINLKLKNIFLKKYDTIEILNITVLLNLFVG